MILMFMEMKKGTKTAELYVKGITPENGSRRMGRIGRFLALHERHAGRDYELPKTLQNRQLKIAEIPSYDLVGMLQVHGVIYDRSIFEPPEPLNPSSYVAFYAEIFRRYSGGGTEKESVERSLSAFSLDMPKFLEKQVKPIMAVLVKITMDGAAVSDATMSADGTQKEEARTAKETGLAGMNGSKGSGYPLTF